MRKLTMWFPNKTQTKLYKHRRWLQAENFGFRRKRYCTICEAKNKGADQLACLNQTFKYPLSVDHTLPNNVKQSEEP